jgi:integrator complex subunit 4
MAAKLKKRAMAEYQSQTQVEDSATLEESRGARNASTSSSSHQPQKKLKLVLQQNRSAAAAAASSSSAKSTAELSDPFPIERLSTAAEITSLIVRFIPRIRSLENSEVAEAVRKLLEALLSSSGRDLAQNVRVQLVLALGTVLSYRDKCDGARPAVKDRLEELVAAAEEETSAKMESAMLTFLSKLPEYGITPSNAPLNWKMYELAEEKLKSRRDRHTRIAAINVFGAVSGGGETTLTAKVLSALGSLIQTPEEPRIRNAAFDALLSLHRRGYRLDVGLYPMFCSAMNDDYDGVRRVALRLLHAMALTNPEEKVKLGLGSKDVRLADDAFGKICNGINDLCVQVRELSAELMGTMGGVVSPHFLQQTLDKKLMSNMRLKKSAHDREAKLVASGEWSSGKSARARV